MNKITPRINVKGLKLFAKNHKTVTVLIVAALFSAFYGTLRAKNNATVTKYVVGTVSKGTIAVTVSGTGTVSAANQIDVRARASGDIISLSVKTGQQVAKGSLIASIDSRDASNALQSAQLAYQKLIQAADKSTIISARQALADAQTAQTKSVDNAFGDTGSAVLALSSVVDGMNALLYTNTGYLGDQNIAGLGTTANSYRATAGAEFDKARRDLDALQSLYKSATRASDASTLLSLVASTETAASDMLQALRDAGIAVRYIKGITSNTSDLAVNRSALTLGGNAETSISGWLSDVNSALSNLRADEAAALAAPNNVSAKAASLEKLVQGADPLDIQSQQLGLSQKQEAYNDTFVRAPFNGVVGKLYVKKSDTVSNGAIVATLISKDKIATISLNEVDAAKVKVGDKATLTFDAVDELTLTGEVSDIDLIGTVTQGVVNYTAKIVFDADDPRVLSGMSVSASVITNVKNDILTIPLSAVKTDMQGSYVLMIQPKLGAPGGGQGVELATSPIAVSVETGISNDTEIEIVSGLDEGEQIVSRIIIGGPVKATTQTPSLFGGAAPRGTAGAGSGATRALGR